MDSDCIQELLNKRDDLTAVVASQTAIITNLTATIIKKAATITKLTEKTVAILSAENAELKARLIPVPI